MKIVSYLCVRFKTKNKKIMDKLHYKGKGKHSVRELELIIEQQAEELHLLNSGQKPLPIPDVICSPILAKIEHINSLGKSSWYEVVYFDKHWRSYNGSSTFQDGEKVVKWRYCKDFC